MLSPVVVVSIGEEENTGGKIDSPGKERDLVGGFGSPYPI